MPNAAQRSAAQKKATAPKAAKAAAPAAAEVAPAPKPATAVTAPAGKSIRATIMAMVNEGKSTKEITDVIKAEFPGTKAAEKPSKHISFYRSRMKKDAAEKAAAK